MDDILNWLALQRDTFGALASAAALQRTHAPYARALLANEHGLLDPLAGADLLRDVPPAPLPGVPPALPELKPGQHEMWLRLLTAHHVANRPWPPATVGGAEWVSGFDPDPNARLRLALNWSRRLGRPLTYAAANWSARSVVQKVHGWGDEGAQVQFITTEELIITLAGRSLWALRRLAELHSRAVAVDGLHRLNPQGLAPVRSLLEDANAWGMALFLTASMPHPLLSGDAPGGAGVEPAERAAFTFHPELNTARDLTAAVRAEPEATTLLMMPSRSAALKMLTEFPEGKLLTRSKTVQHLQAESGDAARLTISTWSPSAVNFASYERILAPRLPLPILADACLSAERVSVYAVSEFEVTGSLRACTGVTSNLLAEGNHPQDPQTMWAYWDAVSEDQTDSRNIQQSRLALRYQETASSVAGLFRGGVTVIVQSAEAEAVIEQARGGDSGQAQRFSQMSVKMTQTSVGRAIESGLIEQIGDLYLWKGPYSSAWGVGLP